MNDDVKVYDIDDLFEKDTFLEIIKHENTYLICEHHLNLILNKNFWIKITKNGVGRIEIVNFHAFVKTNERGCMVCNNLITLIGPDIFGNNL